MSLSTDNNFGAPVFIVWIAPEIKTEVGSEEVQYNTMLVIGKVIARFQGSTDGLSGLFVCVCVTVLIND